MHVLILTQFFPPETGAPQARLSAFAGELKKRGIDVSVLTAMPNYPTGRIFADYRRQLYVREDWQGIPVIRTWIYPDASGSVGGRLLSYGSFVVSSIFGSLALRDVDVVFVESPPLFLGLTAYLISRTRRIPFILNVSDLWPASVEALGVVRNRALLGAARGLERFLYRKAWRVCAVTEGMLDEIEGSGIERSKLVLFPNGVDTELFAPAGDELSEETSTFVYTGLHGFAQGLDTILDAAHRLTRRSEIRFVFIGEGPEKLRLINRAVELGLTNVEFRDAVPLDEMPGVFAEATASLVPLRRADLFRSARPSKILPALASGVPVIFAGEGDAARLLRDNECGVVVPPEDPGKLAAAIAHLAATPVVAEEMGTNGRLLVERKYSWSSIVETWLETMDFTPDRGIRAEIDGR